MNVRTCREMEVLLRDMARQSQAIESHLMEPREIPSGAAAHLAGCPGCSAEFERERRMTASLAALAGSVENGGDPAAMEDRLRLAFREYQRDRENPRTDPSTKPGRPVFQPAPQRISLWAAGVAAIIVVSLGVALGIVLNERHPSGEPVESRVTPTASLTNPEVAEPGPSAADAARRFARSPGNDLLSADATDATLARSPAAAARPAAGQAVIQQLPQASPEFIPLFHGGDPQLLEAGQVWRVEMPRGALQSVGMPVVEESRAGRIQVDILLGEDGIARAIRLAQ